MKIKNLAFSVILLLLFSSAFILFKKEKTRQIEAISLKLEKYKEITNLILKSNDLDNFVNQLKSDYVIKHEGQKLILLTQTDTIDNFYGFELLLEKNRVEKIIFFKP